MIINIVTNYIYTQTYVCVSRRKCSLFGLATATFSMLRKKRRVLCFKS